MRILALPAAASLLRLSLRGGGAPGVSQYEPACTVRRIEHVRLARNTGVRHTCNKVSWPLDSNWELTREKDLKCCSLAQRASDVDRASMTTNNALHGDQPKAAAREFSS